MCQTGKKSPSLRHTVGILGARGERTGFALQTKDERGESRDNKFTCYHDRANQSCMESNDERFLQSSRLYAERMAREFGLLHFDELKLSSWRLPGADRIHCEGVMEHGRTLL